MKKINIQKLKNYVKNNYKFNLEELKKLEQEIQSKEGELFEGYQLVSLTFNRKDDKVFPKDTSIKDVYKHLKENDNKYFRFISINWEGGAIDINVRY